MYGTEVGHHNDAIFKAYFLVLLVSRVITIALCIWNQENGLEIPLEQNESIFGSKQEQLFSLF